mmetsp:Transcript_37904/g.118811  ORF Transcript_37904/g.118811 Transcript_37904/m.118811 type:complete len:200 (+) Transcript_37904:606-1205(+)
MSCSRSTGSCATGRTRAARAAPARPPRSAPARGARPGSPPRHSPSTARPARKPSLTLTLALARTARARAGRESRAPPRSVRNTAWRRWTSSALTFSPPGSPSCLPWATASRSTTSTGSASRRRRPAARGWTFASSPTCLTIAPMKIPQSYSQTCCATARARSSSTSAARSSAWWNSYRSAACASCACSARKAAAATTAR